MENVVDSISDIGEQRGQNDVITVNAIAPHRQGRYETQICRLDQSRVASELCKLLRAYKYCPELQNRETLASVWHSRLNVEEDNLGPILRIHWITGRVQSNGK